MLHVGHRASDEVAELHRHIQRLEDALRPFAKIAEDDFAGSVFEGGKDTTPVLYSHQTGTQVTLGDFRDAVALMRSAEPVPSLSAEGTA